MIINMNEVFDFVKQKLSGYDVKRGSECHKIQYSRFEHTMRVYRWMQELYQACDRKDKIDYDALCIATAFHDVGYAKMQEDNSKEINHAEEGAKICRAFLDSYEFPECEKVLICSLIEQHSDKTRINDDIAEELILLMEADLLDDTGAQGIVLDIWMEANRQNISFQSIAEHIRRFSVRQVEKNPMRTDKGKELWERKRKLVYDFYREYCNDISVETE